MGVIIGSSSLIATTSVPGTSGVPGKWNKPVLDVKKTSPPLGIDVYVAASTDNIVAFEPTLSKKIKTIGMHQSSGIWNVFVRFVMQPTDAVASTATPSLSLQDFTPPTHPLIDLFGVADTPLSY